MYLVKNKVKSVIFERVRFFLNYLIETNEKEKDHKTIRTLYFL